MRSLILAALLAAGPVFAEDAIVRDGESFIRLMDSQCSHGETLGRLLPQWREKFKNARAHLNGKDWYACWILRPDGAVHILYEDGDEDDLPMHIFKPDGA